MDGLHKDMITAPQKTMLSDKCEIPPSIFDNSVNVWPLNGIART